MTRAAPHPTLQRIDQNVYFSCHVLMSSLEKQIRKTNPGHSTLAVIDKLQKRRRGANRWGILTSKWFPCFVLAFVCPLSMCEGEVSVLDHVLETTEKRNIISDMSYRPHTWLKKASGDLIV